MKRPNDVFSYGGRIYGRNDLVEDDDPVVTRNPHLFEDAVPVERATARPGEKRATKRPAKKKAAAPKAD